jgi:hypothetical protein
VLCATASLELGIWANPALARALAKDAELAGKGRAKQLAPPLSATVASARALSRQVARLGAVLGLAWLLEFHPPFQHAAKSWDRDTYYFLCLLLLLYALQDARTLKPVEVESN